MNKQALLDELTVQFHKLGNVAPVELSPADEEIRLAEGVKWYLAGVYEGADDRLIRKNIPFYVEAEGEAEEAAFYAEKLPTDTLSVPAVTTFRDLIEAKITEYIATDIIVKGVIDSVNEDKEFAFITAYMLVTGEIETKVFFGYNDLSDVLHFTPVKV